MTSAWTRRDALRCTVGRALALTVLVGAVGVGLPSSAGAAEGTSFVTMAIEQGVHGGVAESRLWRTGAGEIAVAGSADGRVEVEVSGGTSGEAATLNFAAPSGASLVPGAYEGALPPGDASADRPRLQVSRAGETCLGGGRFTVLDMAADLSSLWLVYDQQCGTGRQVFGEIRYGLPAADPDLLVAAGQISWPGADVHAAGEQVPVTLVNTGTEPVTISDASGTGGNPDFGVNSWTCGTLDPGATCVIRIGFAPTAAGTREGTLTVVSDTAVGSQTVALTGRGYGGNSSLSLYSQDGYFAGTGTESYSMGGGAQFTASGDASKVDIQVKYGMTYNTLRFTAAAGDVLPVGSVVTDSSPAEGAPGPDLRIWPCKVNVGDFIVHELALEDGKLSAFSATFTHRCTTDKGKMFGSVTWRAAQPARPMPGLAGLAPEPVSEFSAKPGYDSLDLTWTDPQTPDWATTVVRGALGTKAPTSPTGGFAVYSGKAGGTTVGKLRLGSTISYAAFARDSEGLVAPRATLTVHGSSMTLVTSAAKIVYGGKATLSGTLLDAQTKKGIWGAAVNVWARSPGKTTWYTVGKTKTGSGGKWKLSVDPGQTYEFWVFHDGTDDGVDHLGAAAGPVKISVATFVDVFAPKTKGKLGTKFDVLTAVGPAAAGKNVQLQEYVKGKWKTVAEAKLKKDVTTLSVKPKSKGTHTYRIYKAGDSKRSAGTSKSVKIKVT